MKIRKIDLTGRRVPVALYGLVLLLLLVCLGACDLFPPNDEDASPEEPVIVLVNDSDTEIVINYTLDDAGEVYMSAVIEPDETYDVENGVTEVYIVGAVYCCQECEEE